MLSKTKNIVFGDFSFADDEEILLDVPAGDTGDGKIGKSFKVKDEAMLTAAADAVKFTNSVGNAERQMAVLFKQLDIDGDGLISRREVTVKYAVCRLAWRALTSVLSR